MANETANGLSPAQQTEQLKKAVVQQIEQQKIKLFETQTKKDRFVLNSQKMTVPPANEGQTGNSDYTIVIDSDADFLIEGLTASYYYYGWGKGDSANTIEDMPEILTAPAARKIITETGYDWNDPDFMNHLIFAPDKGYGLDDAGIKITDGRNNRLLTDNFTPLQNISSGGAIGKPMMMVMQFSHFCKASGTLRLELVNNTDKHLKVMLAFHGWKFFL